jgi:hypothetical protein
MALPKNKAPEERDVCRRYVEVKSSPVRGGIYNIVLLSELDIGFASASTNISSLAGLPFLYLWAKLVLKERD